MTGGTTAPGAQHVLDRADTNKAHGEAVLAKRRRTFEQRADRRREQVRKLAERGLPAATIADELKISDRVVRKHLHALETG